MSNYALSADIDNIFGRKNVDKWADLNNDGDAPTIAARRAWALALATEKLDDALRQGGYAVPFATDTTLPLVITDTVARNAGVLLYDSRGLADSMRDDQGRPINILLGHRQQVDKTTADIRSRKIRLNLPLVVVPYPRVVRWWDRRYYGCP